MPQSLSFLGGHIVFSTKNRAPVLTGDILPKLYAYVSVIMAKLGCRVILIGGTANHVHILASLPRDNSPSKILEEIKKSSSKWLKTQGAEFAQFHWQTGYGLFSVSSSNLSAVEKYIAKQEEHHKKMSFEDEFRAILKKHNIEFDERYVWD